MAAARTEFIRQSPRVALRGGVMITLASGGDPVLGHLLDISASGIAVRTDRRLRSGERIQVLLDPHALPDSDQQAGLPALAGEVTWAVRDGQLDGQPMFRAGIAFLAVPDKVQRRLRELPRRARGSSQPPIAGDDGSHELAQSPAGREKLYQLALTRLADGDLDGAREATRASLAVIPHARHMRALLCRIEAEAALAGGQREEARSRIGHGRRLSPDDPVWSHLERRASAGDERRGFWSRLFHG
jgi:hypothetical protein